MMEEKRKKILVTGANSFIGSNLVNRLIKENYEIHILTRKTSNLERLKNNLPNLKNNIVDLTEKEKLEVIIKEIKPNIIFHLATQGIYGGVQAEDDKLIRTNFIGTKNLIDSCNSISYTCFVNTGSSSEYGIKPNSMKENDVCVPINLYGITKNAATKYGQFVALTKNKPIISLRLFSPFGYYDQKDRLISYAIVKSIRGESLELANPDSVRDYIFIEDVVDLYIKSIKKAKEFKGEIFNVGTGIQNNIKEVIEKITKITKSSSKINWGSEKSRDYDNGCWVADIEKTKKVFNWEPQYDLEEGLIKTIKWFEKRLINGNS